MGTLLEYHCKENQRKNGVIDELRAELEELRAWKEQALSTTPPLQEIGRELGLQWGDTIHDKILPGIRALKAENATLTADLAECECWYSGPCGIFPEEKDFCPVCRARAKIQKEPPK